jgi:pyrroloquinoline quinone (PQQ) biosynthesis protein C
MMMKAGYAEFVDEIVNDIIEPGVDDLLDSRYFRDLRAGKLTVRRLQGFAIQHYLHNVVVLKAFALGAIQHAATTATFLNYINAMNEELTHPEICKGFGLSLGLTEQDFEDAIPVFGPLAHTAAVIHGVYLANVPEVLANGLSNETMVQKYCTEFNDYLQKEPYGYDEDVREFFIVHMGADMEHTARSAKAIAELATTNLDQEKVRNVCRNMARFKLQKFESIYDEYA